MARDLVWRRTVRQYQGEDGFTAVDANGWITYWCNVATLTVGQTTTRSYGSILFSRLSSAAGDYQTLSMEPILLGAYLQADSAGDTPTITPAGNVSDQSWFLYDMVTIEREWQQQYSNDGREIAKFNWENHAQRKAKGTGTATTSVKFCWSVLSGTAFSAPAWQMHAFMAATGVLLP